MQLSEHLHGRLEQGASNANIQRQHPTPISNAKFAGTQENAAERGIIN
jgi:hypothetical protein